MDDPRSVLALRQAMAGVLESCRPGRRVIVACSGGADSLGLVHALAWEATSAAVIPSAIIVDHGILPESRQIAEGVKSAVEELFPATIVELERTAGGGPEGGARRARYAALATHAAEQSDDPLVLLGHTRNDQAETVLLGLSRGSGPRSIAGMPGEGRLPGSDVAFARPFLHLPRHTIESALTSWGQSWWEDPSNRMDGPWRQANGEPLVRAAIRHDVLPALSTALGSDVEPALAKTADMLQVDLDYLDQVALETFDSLRDGDELDVSRLEDLHEAIATRIIRLWILEMGGRPGELSRTHIESVRHLKNGQISHVPGLRVRRTETRLIAVLR